MRAVIQRVSSASVNVNGDVIGEINNGLLVLLGVADGDNEADVERLLEKIIGLRIFQDDDDRMNLSLIDLRFDLLVVSQFTLLADTRRGRRPSFITAATPDEANRLYELFVERARQVPDVGRIATGRFGAMMDVHLINSGPVTILLDTRDS